MEQPILIMEEYWANSPLSIARHYGGITYNGKQYEIVNKHGETVREISERMDRNHEEGKAIPPGEPADLVRTDWIPVYRKLGRERFIELLKNGISLKEALLL